jgi:GDP/UDP-N,N'-diacetylbacillosamine 2-epimerase (hydrolysing)
MKIAILTSSRADYGIYLPLIKKLKADQFFEVDIIAFGTHLSNFHGQTIQEILNDGFDVKYRIESMLLTDTPDSISTAMGLTTIKFADFWKSHAKDFDLVFCLGDRYEMFAAVVASIPFNIPLAHFHGGETTLGAIDNIFRHSISLASTYHFVATEAYAEKVKQIKGSSENVYEVGALSLENIDSLNLLSIEEFLSKWSIDLSKPTILTTFHPETVNSSMNQSFAMNLIHTIQANIGYQFIITMPNTDTAGGEIRRLLNEHLSELKHVFLIENLGPQSYLSAMKQCAFLLGNTSSGIIEAASFHKYVINLGDRQEGRAQGDNVINVPILEQEIQKAIDKLAQNNVFKGENIYFKANTATEVVKALKQING